MSGRMIVEEAHDVFPDQPFVKFRSGMVHACRMLATPTLFAHAVCGWDGWVDPSSILADHSRSILDDNDSVCKRCVAELERRAVS